MSPRHRAAQRAFEAAKAVEPRNTVYEHNRQLSRTKHHHGNAIADAH